MTEKYTKSKAGRKPIVDRSQVKTARIGLRLKNDLHEKLMAESKTKDITMSRNIEDILTRHFDN
jgi:hypothetical protein